MALINEIQIGTVAAYNGMTMFRKFDGRKGFQTVFNFIDDDTLTEDSNIVVNYVEFYKNQAGEVIERLTEYKFYVVPNTAAFPAASGWFTQLARTPITAPGIMDSIEATLAGLPIDVPNGYVLQIPLNS